MTKDELKFNMQKLQADIIELKEKQNMINEYRRKYGKRLMDAKDRVLSFDEGIELLEMAHTLVDMEHDLDECLHEAHVKSLANRMMFIELYKAENN